MIIGIDAACLSVRDPSLQGGVYQVAKELVLGLAKRDIKNTYWLYVFDDLPPEISNKLPLHFIEKKIARKGFMKIGLPLSLIRKKPDVFLAVSQAMPWYHPFKTIGIVHGLDFVPEFHNYSDSLPKLEKQTAFLAKHADTLVTTSTFLQKQITKQFHRKDVLVHALGVNSLFTPNGEVYQHPVPYFLFVGALKPSKNIPTLLRAFAAFLATSEKLYDLLLIGSTQWSDPAIEKVIAEEKLEDRVQILPALAHDALPLYYRGATAFISIASYEGFGLPLLEAMACGIPVITGNTSAEQEIIGDAGICVNPQQSDEVVKSMQEMTMYPKLHELLHSRAVKKSKEYSWDTFVEQIRSIIAQYEHPQT